MKFLRKKKILRVKFVGITKCELYPCDSLPREDSNLFSIKIYFVKLRIKMTTMTACLPTSKNELITKQKRST